MSVMENRQTAKDRAAEPESLLQIPLVRQAFCDSSFRFIARSTDSAWTYHRRLPISLTGFNPFEFSFYYGQGSQFAVWLDDPFGSARTYNDDDFLLREVLFMVHDYLHAWTYSLIEELCPSLHVLHGPITAETLEDYVFCHLLTEAAATVGLDYWFLCTQNVNELCPIGSNIGALTVDYREALLPEYRRFCPDLQVQTPDFFRTIAVFYCTGEFPGFDASDIRRSPQLLRWLRHELRYGATQRALAREWLAYMAHEPLLSATPSLDAPITVATEERSHLIDAVGARLWAKVKEPGRGSDMALKLPSMPSTRHAPPGKLPDFRFVNIAQVPVEQWAGMQPASEENFKFFLYQFLGQMPFSSVPEGLLKHIPLLLRQRDVALVMNLMRDLPWRDARADEPRDLLIAN